MFRHTSYSPTVRTAAVADPLTYQLEHFYSPADRQGCAAVQASSAELQAGGGKIVCLGKDLRGNPTYLVRASNHFPPKSKKGQWFSREETAETSRALVAHARAENPDAKLCLVVDMQHYAMANVDRGILKYLGAVADVEFPDAVEHIYVIRPPLLVWMLWKLIKPLVPKKKLEELTFLDKPELLAQNIAQADALPSCLGGQLAVGDEAEWAAKSALLILTCTPCNTIYDTIANGNVQVVAPSVAPAVAPAAITTVANAEDDTAEGATEGSVGGPMQSEQDGMDGAVEGSGTL